MSKKAIGNSGKVYKQYTEEFVEVVRLSGTTRSLILSVS